MYVGHVDVGHVYVGHVSSNSGSAKKIVAFILSYPTEQSISLEYFYFLVGCDGTHIYTGRKGGAIRQLEVHFG